MTSGTLVHAPSSGRPRWVFVVCDAFIVMVDADASPEVIRRLWALTDAADPTVEDLVGAIPLAADTSGGRVVSFAIVRFAETALVAPDRSITAVVRGEACVDVFSIGGARRFSAGGVEPWVLADFRSVVAVGVYGSTVPVRSSPALPSGTLPLKRAALAADRVLWAHPSVAVADEPWAGAAPGAETPGAETLGAETPGAETLDAETLGVETPVRTVSVAETSTSEAPFGEVPFGEASTGEAPTGEAPTGEAPTGEAPTGEAPTGEAPTVGAVATGGVSAGGAPASETPVAETPANKTPASGASDGERPDTIAPIDDPERTLLRAEAALILPPPTAIPDDDTVLLSRSGTRTEPATHEPAARERTGHAAAGTEPPRFTVGIGSTPAHALGGPIVIGRKPSAGRVPAVDPPTLVTVTSPHGAVSSSHVRIEPQGGTVVVTDLRSTNGTFVDIPGRRRRRVRPGESFTIPGFASIDIGDGNIIEITPIAPDRHSGQPETAAGGPR